MAKMKRVRGAASATSVEDQDVAAPASVLKPLNQKARPGGKLGLILDRLASEAGATADELVEITGWKKNTVLGALSRLRTRGFDARLKTESDRRAYRLEQAEA